jgi:hypothetical protein
LAVDEKEIDELEKLKKGRRDKLMNYFYAKAFENNAILAT